MKRGPLGLVRVAGTVVVGGLVVFGVYVLDWSPVSMVLGLVLATAGYVDGYVTGRRDDLDARINRLESVERGLEARGR